MRSPRIALAVNTFLGYTHVWIYRQITDEPSKASLVLCHRRECEQDFPFEPVCVSPIRESRLRRKLRGKLWPIFRYFPPRLPQRNAHDYAHALRENDINLVHVHFATTGATLASFCQQFGIPLIVTAHGFDITSAPRRWPAYRRALQPLWHQCRFVIAISEHTVRQLRELGCPRDRIRLSYTGVPVDEFPFVDRSGRNRPVRFLHAGRLTSKKGVPDLVWSFAQAFQERDTAILDIVGDGEERELVKQAVTDANPSNQVNVVGRLSNEELAEARKRADVFVLNSRIDETGCTEGLPSTILEAACTGLPSISTRHAGIPESILDRQTGLLVDESDNNALSRAMRELAIPHTRLAMGRAARAFVEQKFASREWNAKLGKLYEEAAGLTS